MNQKLKAVIIGYGKMGRIREQCIIHNSRFELVGICDSSAEIAQTVKVPFCTDYKELLSLKPDIAFTCTPNGYLPEIVTFFISHRVHVFCEKPPGKCKEDVQLMMGAERANPGIKLKFGFNHRYHEPIRETKSIIEKGRFGSIMWMRGIYGKSGGNHYEHSWRSKPEIAGGGILIDQGIHMLDLFRLFCGDFEEVSAFIGKYYWPAEVEDNVFAILRNQRGQVAMLHSSATQWQHKFLLDIYLEKGYFSILGILSSTQTYGTETLKIARCVYDKDGYPLPNPEETVTYYDEDQSWMMEIEEFAQCVIEDKPIENGLSSDAYKTLELVEKIYSADKEWHPFKAVLPVRGQGQ